jgi:hypothetical protein
MFVGGPASAIRLTPVRTRHSLRVNLPEPPTKSWWMAMSNQSKPSIVFAHGLWADGSCFSKLIPTLLAEGHEVMASQHGLDSAPTQEGASSRVSVTTASRIQGERA